MILLLRNGIGRSKKFSCDQEGFCKHLVNKETVKFAWSNFWKEEYLANEILFLKIWFPVIQQCCLQWSLIVEWEHHDLGLLHHFSLKQDNLVLLLIIDKATTSKERIKGKKKTSPPEFCGVLRMRIFWDKCNNIIVTEEWYTPSWLHLLDMQVIITRAREESKTISSITNLMLHHRISRTKLAILAYKTSAIEEYVVGLIKWSWKISEKVEN